MASTPILEPYIEKDYDINFKLSIFEAFLLIFIAELGDKTFIMLIILQLKSNCITVFVSSLFAELLMNFLAIVMGYFIDFLLYKNLIDYIGILISFMYGLFLLGSSFREENISFATELVLNQKNYETSFTELLEESKIEKNEETRKNQRYPLNAKLETISEVDASKEETKHFKIKKEGYSFPKIENTSSNMNSNNTNNSSTSSNPNVQLKRNDTELEIALNEILDKNKENEEDKKLDINVFWTIFKTMILSEFFDRTQISTLSMSSIFNFSGVLIGSSIALTITCYLGAYQGKNMIKILKEKVLSFILGCIFIAYAIQVYIGKQRDSTQTTAPVV
jgi:putative Ca2+/H+ antiporter (TMEM165/GDT1 family)